MAGSKAQKKDKGWRFRVNLGPLSIFLWGIFILFFMSWIFVLGIFVGRGFAPDEITDISEIKGELIRLTKPIENETREDTYSAPTDTTEETVPELAFFNRLTTKKDESRNNLKTEEKTSDRTVSEAPAKASAAPASGADNVKSSGNSAVKSGSGQYTIQVASISELANAEKAVKELLEKGFDAYYYEATVKGKKYYRVRCGRFSDRAEAQIYSLKLEEKTGLKGYVTGVE